MFIVRRWIDKRRVIGENVYSTILGIKGNEVRMSIDAPKDIWICCLKIYNRIEEKKPQQSQKIGMRREMLLGLTDETSDIRWIS